jgi:predicted dehydrogenase/ectoine hydroxylase-related dioxygenase (phytanoyl-CoA dioxygenase family)
VPQVHDVLIVGVGSIGERHLRCFLASERARVSFVEVNASLRAFIAERYPGTTAHESLEAALAQSIEAAVIATPAPLHVPQAMQLAERGVHLLIEKPLSVGLDGIDALIELVARKHITSAVAYVMRANPTLAEMRDQVISGRFGKPLELIVVSGQNFPFYRPAYRDTYYARRESGGGAVQDALTHVLNAGEWLAGEIDRVVADAAHLVLPGVDVEDTVHVLARHGDVLASYSLNQHQAPNETTITVVCERGTLKAEMHANRWRFMERPGDVWTDYQLPSRDRDAPFIAQANAFLDAVEGKAAPLCSLEEGAATLRANVAILKSTQTAGWVLTREKEGKSMDSARMAEEYERNGCVRMKQFFDAGTLASVRQALDRYVSEIAPGLPEGDRTFEADRVTVRNLWRMDQHDPFFAALAARDEIVSVVRHLVHGQPVLMAVETFNKPARVGSGVPPHQDNAYFCQSPPDVLTIWIAMDAATEANGPIFYLKGSHRARTLPHRPSGVAGNSMGLAKMPSYEETDVLRGTLDAGDAIIHHCETIHWSARNQTDHPRCGLLMVFRGAHTVHDPKMKEAYDAARAAVATS